MHPRRLASLLIAATICAIGAGPGSAPAARYCATWKVTGTWTVRQSNTGPAVVFVFHQNSAQVVGTGRVGPVSNNFHGTLTGTISKDRLVFVVTWNRRASDGRMLKGHYAGSVAAKQIVGTSYALTGVRDVATWIASGHATC